MIIPLNAAKNRPLRILLILALLPLLAGCEYSGHTVKAHTGRRVGDTVKGTEYSIGCEVQFRREK